MHLKTYLAVAVDVDYFCLIVLCFTRGEGVVAVNVTVQVVARFECVDQPTKSVHASVRVVITVVQARRRRVGHEDIQITSVKDLIEEEARNHFQDHPPHSSL